MERSRTMNTVKQEIGAQLFNLSNGDIDVVLCNYGCTIVSISVPDKDGQKKNVVAGFSSTEEYKNNPHYLGCTVGRFANRIAFGKFKIDDKVYQLECNNGLNHLHGGIDAFHKQIWEAEKISNGLEFHYLSKDGEEGYPGNLNVTVKYSFADGDKLVIDYAAATDKPTIISLTNHSYFNLTGFESPTICNHFLKIYAGHYTVKNGNNVSSGEIESVSNTPYDFTKLKLIGKHIDLLAADMGYDINYVLDNKSPVPALAAELYEPESGRLLKIFTDQPGLQLYTANWWDGSFFGQQNKPYNQHGAVALETQAFPDSPNHSNFPNTITRPGDVYRSQTIYQFSLR